MGSVGGATYERFVDEMVEIGSRSVAVNRIRQAGHPVRTNDADLPLNEQEQCLKTLFLRLAPEERSVLADALMGERQSGLHDFAAFLQWAIVCDDLRITWAGEAIGEAYNTMHGDFIGRTAGDDWSQYREE